MVHSYQQNKSDTISTIVEAVNVEALQDALTFRRNVFIQGYLSQDFKAIETTLADNFRFVNGKAIHTRDSWYEILNNSCMAPKCGVNRSSLKVIAKVKTDYKTWH